MLDAHADRPHAVPPQVFMPWKENWCFTGVDQFQRTAMVWHISLRPVDGEGIFTCKFDGPDLRIRHVGRHPIGRGVDADRPLTDGAVRFEVIEPHREFLLTFDDADTRVECIATARFGPFDFADGNLAPGTSPIGELGRHVFPFNHYEQSLSFTARITRRGHDDVTLTGWGNRDHSWGWRDDFGFRSHQWICANFEDAYVQGSTMVDTTYPDRKYGGFVSDHAGNDPVVDIDISGAYWGDPPNEPLPHLDRDVTYVIRTERGRELAMTAHLSDHLRILYLNARHPDRSQVYQDAQVFCPFTLDTTGQHGVGLLELGKHLSGEGIADRVGRR